MKQLSTLVLAFLLAGSAAAQSGSDQFAVCSGCHGERAQGDREQGAPRLNHLSQVYIAAQLEKFRSGQRGGEGASEQARRMAATARALDGEPALIDISAYIAGLDSAPSPATVSGDAALGAKYFRQLCAGCHGSDGSGNRALHAPRLAGSDDWYLEAQLQAFRSGARGTHTGDDSGRQMRSMAMALPDGDAVRDVVAYLRSLAD